jgi:hypothetical protein
MKTLARAEHELEILRRLQTVRPDSTPQWGQMSAHQMICHLSDACRMALGLRPVSAAAGPLQRTILKWVALYAPMRWPRGIPTRPEIDQACSGTSPGDFAADVAQLAVLLRQVAARSQSAACPDHPIFGRMSQSAWLRWAYLHADHHLRQFGA